MNPNINSRWGLMCPSCKTKLINPNQPWPQACATCGQRTHIKCLHTTLEWLVDLDTSIDPHKTAICCTNCRNHAANNAQLIQNIPAASGSQPQDIYKRFVAQLPAAPKRPVTQLWGPYRVDPDNFIPAVTKVLDIVHSAGPKLRWAVKLAGYGQTPMTNLASKEIILPNYFESPNALGRTHHEILDAMTGAAMHEAGHAAYDSAATMIEAQKRIKPGVGQYTWAGAMCLNIVCDYNLERKVIERYPAFRHYFSECHRWSVRDSLPLVVKALQDQGAEDQMNVRLGVLVWELLGPGDLEAAGGHITPKLKYICQKAFDVLKYAFTKGLLDTEPGKLKTARALYELTRVVNPVGYTPPVQIPQPPQPGTPGTQTIGGYPGQQGDPQNPDDESQTSDAQGTTQSSTGDPGRTGEGSPDTLPESGVHAGPDESDSDDAGAGSGEPEEDPGSEAGSSEGDSETESDQGSGSEDSDGTGARTDTPEDGDTDPGDGDLQDDSTTDYGFNDGSKTSDTEDEDPGQGSQDHDDGQWRGNSVNDDAGIADNTGPEGEAAEPSSVDLPSPMGGKSGSEVQTDPANDPFTGAGDLQDDPSRRKNSKKDALDDLNDQNEDQDKIDPTDEAQNGPLTQDESFTAGHRSTSEQLSNPPPVQHLDPTLQPWQASDLTDFHANRVRELSPTISRLKKILRFRNADWGGKQTGRRSGTLTRRHVARLSALGSDKVFHKNKPDETPKVRIALLIDESESMNGSGPTAPYIAAKNAATALTQALHGIRGVKLWSWGFSLNRNPYATGRKQVPTLRAYVDPIKPLNPAVIEVSPMNGGTPTGEAMDYAAEVLYKNSAPDEKKIVFIITDGEAGGFISTASAVRKWSGKVTFVHIGIGHTVDKDIPFYIGPVTDVTLLPDLLSESVSEILR